MKPHILLALPHREIAASEGGIQWVCHPGTPSALDRAVPTHQDQNPNNLDCMFSVSLLEYTGQAWADLKVHRTDMRLPACFLCQIKILIFLGSTGPPTWGQVLYHLSYTSILLILVCFQRFVLLLGLALDYNPTSDSWVARIIGMYHHAQPPNKNISKNYYQQDFTNKRKFLYGKYMFSE
jgi:hypothetical protein